MIASIKNRKLLLILFIFTLVSSLGSLSEAPPSSWSGSCLAVRRYSCIAECVLKGCYHAHCQRKMFIGKCSCQLCNRRTLDVSELNCFTSSGDCDRKCGEVFPGARGKCLRHLVSFNTYTNMELCDCWIH
jgi:hypothetical protein